MAPNTDSKIDRQSLENDISDIISSEQGNAQTDQGNTEQQASAEPAQEHTEQTDNTGGQSTEGQQAQSEQGQSTAEQAEETVEINGQTYKKSELAEVVQKGQHYSQLEDDHNVDFSQLLPDYTRKSQRVKELEKQVNGEQGAQEPQSQDQTQSQGVQSQGQNQEGQPSYNPNDPNVQAALQDLKEKGAIDDTQLRQMQGQTSLDPNKVQEMIDNRLNEFFEQQKEQQQMEAKKQELQEQAQSITSQWNGENGKPKVTQNELVQKAKELGTPDLEYALFKGWGDEINKYNAWSNAHQRGGTESAPQTDRGATPPEGGSNQQKSIGQMKVSEKRKTIRDHVENILNQS